MRKTQGEIKPLLIEVGDGPWMSLRNATRQKTRGLVGRVDRSGVLKRHSLGEVVNRPDRATQ